MGKNKVVATTAAGVVKQAVSSQSRENTFTQKDISDVWTKYIKLLYKNNKNNLGSILSANNPKLEGNKILFSLGSVLMKDQITRIKNHLVDFIRNSLSNDFIELIINIESKEIATKKYVYSDADKLDRMIKDNSTIELLKKTFHLDV